MEDVLLLAQIFLEKSWDMFTGITVPGLGVSFTVFTVGLFLISFSLRLLSYILGLSFGDGGTGSRSGGRGKHKTSKEREYDEK